MKKLVLLLTLLIMSFLLFNCDKDIFFNNKPKKEVTLHYSFESVKGGFELVKENNGGKGPISSGATIQGPVGHFLTVFLMPADEDDYAEGIFVIKNSIGDTIYKSSHAENGCEYKFSLIGTYTLSVSGFYNGQFSFVNITIIITDNSTPPPPTSTIPRLYDFIIDEENNTCRITAVIHKGYYISQSNWFGVKRVNGLNFVSSQPVTVDGDSVRYTIEFPAVDQTYVEFNFAVNNGVAGGTWMTPTNETLLYSGYENSPYNSSGSWFGFKLFISNGIYQLKSYSGELILSSESEVNFPGRNGDDVTHNYTMRWSGYTHWIKTNNTQQIVRYKVAGSNFIYPTLTDWISPIGTWKKFTVSNNTTGEVHYQIGHWTSNVFIADINITSASQYYEQNDTSFVQIF